MKTLFGLCLLGAVLINSTLRAAPKGAAPAVWRQDVTRLSIPSVPAQGKIHGQSFTVDRAEIVNGVLSLKQGKDLFGDRRFSVHLSLKPGEKPDGRLFTAGRQSGFDAPRVFMEWRINKDKLPETLVVKSYTMRLQFGTTRNGKLPGSIYLCVMDPHKSFVVGQFEAAATPKAILDQME
jgi:hypothetical protein